MGKRPKDVYSRLSEYIEVLSKHTQFAIPERGPVHVLPKDVFDIAIIAMVYSRKLHFNDSTSLKINVDSTIDSSPLSKKPDFITPSHVYQAVVKNIQILECMTHAS